MVIVCGVTGSTDDSPNHGMPNDLEEVVLSGIGLEDFVKSVLFLALLNVNQLALDFDGTLEIPQSKLSLVERPHAAVDAHGLCLASTHRHKASKKRLAQTKQASFRCQEFRN